MPGAATDVAGLLSLPNRTVTVVLGTGETVVTYEDIPALPGTSRSARSLVSRRLRLHRERCSRSRSRRAPRLRFRPSLVPVGNCTIVGNFPFDTTVSIVEAAVANVTVQSITATPTLVVVGGSNTNQNVLTNVNLPGRSASATIGENNITEVTYVNIDPPSVNIDPPSTGGGSTGSSGGGSTGSTG